MYVGKESLVSVKNKIIFVFLIFAERLLYVSGVFKIIRYCVPFHSLFIIFFLRGKIESNFGS